MRRRGGGVRRNEEDEVRRNEVICNDVTPASLEEIV